MIAIGTCSKLPIKLPGRRVRVLAVQRDREWPRPDEIGIIHSVNGRFAPAHDGLEECGCVHVDEMSSFSVTFDDGETWSGYPPRALELVKRCPMHGDHELVGTGTSCLHPFADYVCGLELR